MPYSAGGSNLPDYVKKLSDRKQRQWVAIWNSAYDKAQADGKSAKEAESSAFAQANGVVMKDASLGSVAKRAGDAPAEYARRVMKAIQDADDLVLVPGYVSMVGSAIHDDDPGDIDFVIKQDKRLVTDYEAESVHLLVRKMADPTGSKAIHLVPNPQGPHIGPGESFLPMYDLVLRPRYPEMVTKRAVAKAQWTTAYMNNLPDSSFAYIESGGEKDDEGKTTPRDMRHLPYKDADGSVDAAHTRNALARLPNMDIPDKDAIQSKLEAALARVNKHEVTVTADVMPIDGDPNAAQQPQDVPAQLPATGGGNPANAQTGVAIMMYLQPDVASMMAFPDGEAPEQLHCTLAYLGDINDLPPDTVQQAVNALTPVAAQYPPVSARISGVGRFMASTGSDNQDVVYASVDAPGLNTLREHVCAALEAAGLPVSEDHGFTPHVTLQYVDPSEPAAVPMIGGNEVRFDQMTIGAGGQYYHLPFGAGPDASQNQEQTVPGQIEMPEGMVQTSTLPPRLQRLIGTFRPMGAQVAENMAEIGAWATKMLDGGARSIVIGPSVGGEPGLLVKRGPKTLVVSVDGDGLTDRSDAFWSVCKALQGFPRDLIVQGEIVDSDDGEPQFFINDLLYDGDDRRAEPVLKRLDILEEVEPHLNGQAFMMPMGEIKHADRMDDGIMRMLGLDDLPVGGLLMRVSDAPANCAVYLAKDVFGTPDLQSGGGMIHEQPPKRRRRRIQKPPMPLAATATADDPKTQEPEEDEAEKSMGGKKRRRKRATATT